MDELHLTTEEQAFLVSIIKGIVSTEGLLERMMEAPGGSEGVVDCILSDLDAYDQHHYATFGF